MLNTQKQVRAQFWEDNPKLEKQARAAGTKSKGQNAQNVNIRCAFVDYVDALCRSGEISEKLANNVTL